MSRQCRSCGFCCRSRRQVRCPQTGAELGWAAVPTPRRAPRHSHLLSWVLAGPKLPGWRRGKPPGRRSCAVSVTQCPAPGLARGCPRSPLPAASPGRPSGPGREPVHLEANALLPGAGRAGGGQPASDQRTMGSSEATGSRLLGLQRLHADCTPSSPHGAPGQDGAAQQPLAGREGTDARPGA